MLFWKKDKPKTNSQEENKTQELADLNLENLNHDLHKTKTNPEIEQYLDHDAKISAQTKAYLQNQQTKVLELDDLESLLNEQETTNNIAASKKTAEFQQDYQAMINEQEEQLKHEFIEPMMIEPMQNPVMNTVPIVEQAPTWDFEKLIPISEPKINLRIHKTEKRTLSN